MPIYTYKCNTNELHILELSRPINERDKPVICHECLVSMNRVLDFQGAVYAPTAGGMR